MEAQGAISEPLLRAICDFGEVTGRILHGIKCMKTMASDVAENKAITSEKALENEFRADALAEALKMDLCKGGEASIILGLEFTRSAELIEEIIDKN